MSQESRVPVGNELDQTAGIMRKFGIGCLVVIGNPFLIFGLVAV
jgi:hypothetical protein